MTESAINPNINAQYPNPGDNDSQVFRDNFSSIKSSLSSAKTELSDLLENSLRSDISNDLNGILIENETTKKTSIYRHDIGLKTRSFDIDYRDGIYQTVQIGANVGIKLKNFPVDSSTSETVGKLRLQISADRTTRTIEFVSPTVAIKYPVGFPFTNNKISIPGSTGKDPVVLDIWQVNNKTSSPTIYVEYISQFVYISPIPAPAAPTSYYDSVAPITNTHSTALQTNDEKPGINIGTAITLTPILYIDGVHTDSIYDIITGTLTPVANVSIGTHTFTYALADQSGNESNQSPALTVTVDTTAPNTGSIALTVDDGISSSDGISSNGSITVSGLESGATWEYSTNSGSSWSVGTGTTFTLSVGSYGSGTIKVRQTDAAGNIQTSNIATNASPITITQSGGQVAFTTPGVYDWVAPAGVTSVCVVAVGGGGSGGSAWWAGGGGGGGGLAYANNRVVVPGNTYQVIVGAGGISRSATAGGMGSNGGLSSFAHTPSVVADGGTGGAGTDSHDNFSLAGGVGGSYSGGDGGGVGGDGGSSLSDTAGGGGGAAGYTGNGGNGGSSNLASGVGYAGNGGGGSGGGAGGSNATAGAAPSGGGVGILGQGISGSATAIRQAGNGGSGGMNGSGDNTIGGSSATGGNYGGGGGGQSDDGSNSIGCNGGDGAVRIIWGSGREFPSTNTADVL